jgi:hypothetical protein
MEDNIRSSEGQTQKKENGLSQKTETLEQYCKDVEFVLKVIRRKICINPLIFIRQ